MELEIHFVFIIALSLTLMYALDLTMDIYLE